MQFWLHGCEETRAPILIFRKSKVFESEGVRGCQRCQGLIVLHSLSFWAEHTLVNYPYTHNLSLYTLCFIVHKHILSCLHELCMKIPMYDHLLPLFHTYSLIYIILSYIYLIIYHTGHTYTELLQVICLNQGCPTGGPRARCGSQPTFMCPPPKGI